MKGRLLPISVFLIFMIPSVISAQDQKVFSGDPVRFTEELINFMGQNLEQNQKTNLNAFINRWDSAAFSRANMSLILDLSTQLVGRRMRAIPDFTEFLETLNSFIDYKRDDSFLSYWLTGLSEMLFDPGVTNQSIITYVRNTSLLIKENILINTGTLKWKAKETDFKFVHDTIFKILITNATLTCYYQKDSTEIYEASGEYYPDLQIFSGTRGIVTWEKAGFPRSDIYAELGKYVIDITKNSFTADSARLFHSSYFKKPVYGILSDQAVIIGNKEQSTYPRFQTYTRQFEIENFYRDINYKGGLAFEGAKTKGTGTIQYPAEIVIFRKDTLFMRLISTEFIFSRAGLSSQEVSAKIFIGKDSIFHSNLGLSYTSLNRQINLFRTSNPISKSPYYNSFHKIDMYFEYLIWNMDSQEVQMTRARGASLGQALFESESFFNADYFLELMGLDNYHPLSRIKQFSDFYYSETFPVSEFAKWLNKPEEIVTGLCIDMANRGFVFYDRTSGEITIKKKLKDYIDSYAKRKDYDVLRILSETKAPFDNAVLNLKDLKLTVNGVAGVFLSDSQRVAIYPYDRKLVIEKNRGLEFDGVVQAGLFTFYGHKFRFSYDTFKIHLQKIDSIRMAVETDKKDQYGNPLIEDIGNLIQLTEAQLYIDDPDNKSGLKRRSQYPIVNTMNYSYIFYDNIPGLEGIYDKKDFYFKIDPFNYENIDHYTIEDINLVGEFYGGKILKPMRQYLVIRDDNSLGFNMNIPPEGIEVYDGKGRLFDEISMSNNGLIGKGRLQHLTSSMTSKEYKFYPDSMLTIASDFQIKPDGGGLYPDLKVSDVNIKWLPGKEELLAVNSKDKSFSMYENNAVLDGSLTLSPKKLTGSGIINMPDSRITSNLFSFTTSAMRADTADYYLKSPSTSGYAFIAENAKTETNFDLKTTSFSLNTGQSIVKFPEIQYNCTMTDFEYNMGEKILRMQQKGRSESGLIPPNRLLRVSFSDLTKPTFFSTNSMSDTVKFTSFSARYNVEKEVIEAEDISYIRVADALIQPDNGRIRISRRARIEPLENAWVAVNNRHLLRSARINIESSKRYSGSAVYDYITENGDRYPVNFPELSVDTLTTTAKGFIPPSQNFMLSPAFSFSGDVFLSARSSLLTFTGSAGILQDCRRIKSYPIKFRASIDPANVMIPIVEKTRDSNDNLVYSGSFINIDSIHIYPAFLSPQKAWSDVGLVNATGVLSYNKSRNQYIITSVEKLVDPSLNGNMVALDRNNCDISGEGRMNFGTNFDLVKMISAGRFTHSSDSGKINIQTILALDFHFSPEALSIMSEDLKLIPSLRSVNLNSEFNNKSMKDLLGIEVATKIKDELSLFGISRSLPKEFTYELLLNDVTLYWNDASSSFRSKGKIGIGFVGQQPVNLYVDGFVEIQRRRSGDMIDIYLKANESTWYYFSYFKGVMMTQAANIRFNTLISNEKIKVRKDPNSSTKVPYTYMIASEDRLPRFLRRMTENQEAESSPTEGLMR